MRDRVMCKAFGNSLQWNIEATHTKKVWRNSAHIIKLLKPEEAH